ncbi:hypothetical protein PTKIN_Ptkin09bG0256700 [Pterospermum kingtungense]
MESLHLLCLARKEYQRIHNEKAASPLEVAEFIRSDISIVFRGLRNVANDEINQDLQKRREEQESVPNKLDKKQGNSTSTAWSQLVTSQTDGSGLQFDLEKRSIMSQQSGFSTESQHLAIQLRQSVSSVAPVEKLIQFPEKAGFYSYFRTRRSFHSELSRLLARHRYDLQGRSGRNGQSKMSSCSL